MAVNRVEINGEPVLDLTQDTVTPQNLLQGERAHNAAGEQIDGAVVVAPASTTSPKAPGTASTGSENAYARGDHVHPKQSVSKSDVGLGNVDNVSVNARLNRSTNVNAADTNYTTYMARGEALFPNEVTPTVNGCIAWQYE